jgi:hypothetical protein
MRCRVPYPPAVCDPSTQRVRLPADQPVTDGPLSSPSPGVGAHCPIRLCSWLEHLSGPGGRSGKQVCRHGERRGARALALAIHPRSYAAVRAVRHRRQRARARETGQLRGWSSSRSRTPWPTWHQRVVSHSSYGGGPRAPSDDWDGSIRSERTLECMRPKRRDCDTYGGDNRPSTIDR